MEVTIKAKIGKYVGNYHHPVDIEIDDEDTFSLKYTLALIILPSLMMFKELNIGYPMDLTHEQWNEILEKMIYSFNFIIRDTPTWNCTQKESDAVEEGLRLFAEWYLDLWW